MAVYITVNLFLFAALVVLLSRLKKPKFSLAQQILAGLIAGVLFGLYLQLFFSGNQPATDGTLEWTNVIGSSYVNLLRMIIMPLILVMMISAVVRTTWRVPR